MKHTRFFATLICALAMALLLAPSAAFAESDDYQSLNLDREASVAPSEGQSLAALNQMTVQQLASNLQSSAVDEAKALDALVEDNAMLISNEHDKDNKVLSYDPAAIAAISTQEESGHSICCPSFSCAYADAVLDGTVNDHSYYTCSCCTWTDWGGGDSFDRCVGSDEELLREAYDQISAGKPTVVHVAWEGGEHWIALIGYENAQDPDHLALDNFVALDPWDGAQINAASKYSLYGDGCEHISDR